LVDQLQPAVGQRLIDLKFLSGRYVQHGRPKGFEEFAKTMSPVKKIEENNEDTDIVTTLNCKGKFIYLILDDGRITQSTDENSDYQRSIWITLGMTGQFINEKDIETPKPIASNSDRPKSGPRWYFELLDPTTKERRKIYYRDTRNFGTLRFSLSKAEFDEKLSKLGPDMMNTTEEVFLAAMDKSTQTRNICVFLMDQTKIAGVGNYILAEGLYRSRLDPFADLSEISTGQRQRLFKELREVITTSYKAQGLTRPEGGTYRTVDGTKGQFEVSLISSRTCIVGQQSAHIICSTYGAYHLHIICSHHFKFLLQFQLQCYGQKLTPNKFVVTREVDGPHKRAIWYSEEEQLFMPRSQRNLKDSSNNKMSDDKQDSVLENSSNEPTYVFTDIPSQLHDVGWKNALSDHMASDSFQSLLDKIRSDANTGTTIYPPPQDVFSALNFCSLEKVKVVIVGQDPYHGPGQAQGLAFSIRQGKPPPSLRNIFKEAMSDVGIDDPKNNGNLEGWTKQGVLLLNTVLTVRRGEANSHAKWGWEEFTDEVIKKVNEQTNSVVFLLWGSPAHKKAKKVDESKHTVIRTSHPSPLGATKTASPFLSSKCFSRANEALIAAGKEPIDWNNIS